MTWLIVRGNFRELDIPGAKRLGLPLMDCVHARTIHATKGPLQACTPGH